MIVWWTQTALLGHWDSSHNHLVHSWFIVILTKACIHLSHKRSWGTRWIPYILHLRGSTENSILKHGIRFINKHILSPSPVKLRGSSHFYKIFPQMFSCTILQSANPIFIDSRKINRGQTISGRGLETLQGLDFLLEWGLELASDMSSIPWEGALVTGSWLRRAVRIVVWRLHKLLVLRDVTLLLDTSSYIFLDSVILRSVWFVGYDTWVHLVLNCLKILMANITWPAVIEAVIE